MIVRESSALTTGSLSSGAVDITFGDFEAILAFMIFYDDPQENDYVYEAIGASSDNTVTVTFYKMQVSATNTWATAGDDDLDGCTLVVIADAY